MDCIEDQPPKFKYYCRICKKGFMCGRALGGHMRAHGIGDQGGNIDDDDIASDWEDKFGGVGRTCRRMYQLRTNPNRLKSCRVCENCGKEFASWKSFLEHGKCSSEDAESLVSSPGSDGEYEGGQRGCQWSKRKRSLRTKVGSFCSSYPSSEDEDLLLAKCLVDLANARDRVEVEPEESCASASKEEERRINPVTAYFNTPLASRVHLDKPKGASKGLFECKACKKVFNSHQALGGHRASHKKVKGCYAAKQDQLDDSSLADDDVITHDEFFPSKSPTCLQFEQGPTMAGASRRKSKVHECTICHKVFSTGQALGGHKRCHWITSNSQETYSLVKLQFHDQMDHEILHQGPAIINESETLDLNIPATQGDHDLSGILRPQNPLSFQVSTDIRLHTWANNLDAAETKCDHSQNCHHQNNKDGGNENDNNSDSNKINNNNINASINGPIENVDDEADSKVKLSKLSDLKDMNLSGGSSQWLQVGIGSTADVTADP